MQDSARLQAVIDLVEEVHHSLLHKGPAADVLIRRYFRSRRYAGSGDRRKITRDLYDVIRRWGALRASMTDFSARKMVLAARGPGNVQDLFTGADHAPTTLTADEEYFLAHLQVPDLSHPVWMADHLGPRFGTELETAMMALDGRAPLTLRANLLKTDPDRLLNGLREAGLDAVPGRWSPTALIMPDHVQFRGRDLYEKGLLEIQDEAAQLAVDLCEFAPGQQIVDFCAGAGGKSLAAAAALRNKGQIYAFDVSRTRLADLKPRAKRAGVHILQSAVLEPDRAARQRQLVPYEAKMDRVMVDAPCSGSGTWRRNPESKWRLTSEDLTAYVALQQEILEQAWPLVRPGGRLIYMTCSLFAAENEQQVEAFLAAFPDARLKDYRDMAMGNCPDSLSSMTGCLQLAPHHHGTDGFFVAILEKKQVP